MERNLQPSMMVGTDTLVEHLNAYQATGSMLPTWKARGADGQDYVLRMELLLHGHGEYWHTASIPYESKLYGIGHLRQSKSHSIDPLLALPPIEGVAPLLGCTIEEPTDDLAALVIRRRYYPERLTERFPPDAAQPPSGALLDAFGTIAHGLDALQAHLPELDFDLAPGDLLMDGDSPVIADYGLSMFVKYIDFNHRMPSSRIESERKAPLLAMYPSLNDLIEVTHAQFATAALYIYVRSRSLIFEDQADPFTESALQSEVMARMQRLSKVFVAIKRYEKRGDLSLWMLPDERERTIVARALARDPAERYGTCVAFVEALRALLI
jgi:hypothetical protein